MFGLLKNKIVILTLFLVFGGLLSSILQYEMMWDFVNYHYFNAWAFLNNRIGMDVALAGLNGFFNPLLDVPLFYLIEYFNDYPKLIYFIQGLWFGALCFVFFQVVKIYLPSNSFKGKFNIFLCMLIAITGNATFLQIGTSTNEIVLAFMVMLALYILIKEIFENCSGSWKPFVIAGFILGSAMGMKLTATLYCVVMGFCLIAFYKKIKFPVRNIALFTLFGFIGFLLFSGFWMLKMWDMFQNPIFPFANAIFKSDWLGAHNFSDGNFKPLNWQEFIIWPIIQSLSLYRDEGKGMFVADFRMIFVYFIFIFYGIKYLYLFIKTKKLNIDPKWLFLTVFFVSSYVVWALLFSITRYYIVTEMVAAIFIVRALFCKLPKTLWGEGFYYSFMLIVIFMLLSTPYFSQRWGQRYDWEKLPMKSDSYF